jgi:hypothetical protein
MNASELIYQVEINDVIGLHESHVDHRHQRLATGKGPNVFKAP